MQYSINGYNDSRESTANIVRVNRFSLNAALAFAAVGTGPADKEICFQMAACADSIFPGFVFKQ